MTELILSKVKYHKLAHYRSFGGLANQLILVLGQVITLPAYMLTYIRFRFNPTIIPHSHEEVAPPNSTLMRGVTRNRGLRSPSLSLPPSAQPNVCDMSI